MDLEKPLPELAAPRVYYARIQEEGYPRMLPQAQASLYRGLYNASDLLGSRKEDGPGASRGGDLRDARLE